MGKQMIVWHCDLKGCDEWTSQGRDEAHWVICMSHNDGQIWQFCSKEHLKQWDYADLHTAVGLTVS
jgi:hypothetical protein